MKRELGTFERALVIADRHAPFHLVSVLCLEDAPAPQMLRNSLKVLQSHHPFLSARLLEEKGLYYFAKLVEPGLPYRVLPRWNDDHWQRVVEVEMANRIDVSTGPLFRCTYLFDSTHQRGEIIMTLYHAIADSFSITRLMHELLTMYASFRDEKTVPIFILPPAPPVESRFPSAYRGLPLSLRSMQFAIQQVVNEISSRIRTRGQRVPPLHKPPTRGHILSIQMPEDFVDALSHRARDEQVTLDGALHAAMMIAIDRHLYAGKPNSMRTISLADLRPYVQPPPSIQELACYVSLLRYTVAVEGGIGFWELGRDLQAIISASLEGGDKFLAAINTESLMKRMTRLKSFRLGATAFNYKGAVPILSSYGNMIVRGVHEYASAYDLGPEFSAQVHLFNKQLSWDFTYLDADMTRDEAIAIVEEIRTILAHAIGK